MAEIEKEGDNKKLMIMCEECGTRITVEYNSLQNLSDKIICESCNNAIFLRR